VAEARFEPAPASAGDDVLILPGESLAKYRGSSRETPQESFPEPSAETSPDGGGEEEAAGPGARTEVAELVAEAVEAERHDVEVHQAVLQHGPEEPSPAPALYPVEPPPLPESVLRAAEAAEAAADAAPGNMESAPAGPAPASESSGPGEPAAGEGGDAAEEPALDAGLAGGEELSGEVTEEPAEEDGSDVEPARMPTSLTATLREQGLRYPHRVSRRNRRRQRGPEEGGRPDRGDRPERGERPGREEQRAVSRPDRAERGERGERPPQPSISDLLKEGQEIIVQIAKEPLGQKGARITSYVALPGRYVVYMPTVEHVGVSRKIGSDEERLRLKRILQKHREGIPGGFILRTAGEGKSEEELRSDMHFLYNLWMEIRAKAEKRKAPALVYHDLDVVERVLRDQLTASFKNIWVDNEEVYERVLRFVERFQPALVSRVKLYTRSVPIFDAFNITQELEKALRPKVWLKSGGYIVINQTEALVAIDINTGKYVGKSNRLEDTIVKTNTDAIKEIVRQIRLRDLGGIIVVDFIDMDERKNRQKVMQALEEAMRADKAPNKILQFNDFGLVAITRKRVKQSLERTLCAPCPYCDGAGYVKSVNTVIGEIIQEAHKIAKAVEGPDVLLRVNPEVAKVLKSSRNDFLQELEEILKRNVFVRSDPTLHQEKFDLA
jgi:ribonuclease G